MIALSLLIDQGFGIYIHQEVCTEVPWDFFSSDPFCYNAHFFYRELYSVNFGPISKPLYHQGIVFLFSLLW